MLSSVADRIQQVFRVLTGQRQVRSSVGPSRMVQQVKTWISSDSGNGGLKCLHLLHSSGFLTMNAGGIWLSLEVRCTFFEEDFLPVSEVIDEVLTQDGSLLLTGIAEMIGHWRSFRVRVRVPLH